MRIHNCQEETISTKPTNFFSRMLQGQTMKLLLSSILAGMMIAFGGAAYLSVGGVVGATLFSVGLLSILHLKASLFTGKAGKLATGEISILKLVIIFVGNFLGTLVVALLLTASGQGTAFVEKANAIMAARNALFPTTAVCLGIGCGFLMYVATSNAPLILTMMCVCVFILSGFAHCVADMFYLNLATDAMNPFIYFCVVVGNVIGCNIPPLLLRFSREKE